MLEALGVLTQLILSVCNVKIGFLLRGPILIEVLLELLLVVAVVVWFILVLLLILKSFLLLN